MRGTMSLLFLQRKYLCFMVASKCAAIARLNTLAQQQEVGESAESTITSVFATRPPCW